MTMLAWNGTRSIAVVAACLNAASVPDFAFTEVEVTHEEYENGVLYERVTAQLRAEGYEEPFVLFDQFEAPAFLLAAVREHLGIGRVDVPVLAFVKEDR
jgi:hypothetical protein